MQEYIDKIQNVVSPLVYAINRHDKLNQLNYCVGGDVIVDSAITFHYLGNLTIYLSDLSKGDLLYEILRDIGYIQVEQNEWSRKFRSNNNLIDIVHFRAFSPEQCVNNSEMTIESCYVDNGFKLWCRPEFFEDIKNKKLNIVNLHEPNSGIHDRIENMKTRGFKYPKSSEKIVVAFNRGADYKELLKPISTNDILTFQQ